MTQLNCRQALPESMLTRATVALFLFVLWAVVITVRLAQFMIVQPERFLDPGMSRSLYYGTIPPLRGRLLDRDGTPLAWSTRVFSLHWHVPWDKDAALHEWRSFRSVLATLGCGLNEEGVLDAVGTTVELRRELDEASIAVLETFPDPPGTVELESRLVRHYYPDPKLRRILGEIEVRDGIELGVSGMEQTHDLLLRGVPGRYSVMRDRRKQWIPETWRSLCDMRPGYDVYLPLRVKKVEGVNP